MLRVKRELLQSLLPSAGHYEEPISGNQLDSDTARGKKMQHDHFLNYKLVAE